METREMIQKIDECRNSLESARASFGPAQAKKAEQFFRILKFDTIQASNAIEGNTISRDEVDVILGKGMTVGNHTLQELFEILGADHAHSFMSSLRDGKGIEESDILKMHRLFGWNMPDIHPGRYRDCPVYIDRPDGTEHTFPAPEEVPGMMKNLMKWYNDNKDKAHPVILAADLHARFVSIHPFRDGNGRVARLLAGAVLLQNGLLPLAVPEIRKRDYARALAEFQKNKNPEPFRNFVAEMTLMTMKDYNRFMIPPTRNIRKNEMTR